MNNEQIALMEKTLRDAKKARKKAAKAARKDAARRAESARLRAAAIASLERTVSTRTDQAAVDAARELLAQSRRMHD
jgi:hypothetical protein